MLSQCIAANPTPAERMVTMKPTSLTCSLPLSPFNPSRSHDPLHRESRRVRPCAHCKTSFFPEFSSGGPDHCTKDCTLMSIMIRKWSRARAAGPVPIKTHAENTDENIFRRSTESPTCVERHPSARAPLASPRKITQKHTCGRALCN